MQIMLQHGGRPHWAKDFHIAGDRDFAPLYSHWHDFKRLREEVDPTGVFVNAFARRTFGLSGGGPGVLTSGGDALASPAQPGSPLVDKRAVDSTAPACATTKPDGPASGH